MVLVLMRSVERLNLHLFGCIVGMRSSAVNFTFSYRFKTVFSDFEKHIFFHFYLAVSYSLIKKVLLARLVARFLQQYRYIRYVLNGS